ncbi:pilus assembly protein TadG-related protein [Sphingomicrobium flavum]|uniref:pilus assembly protein TadG-related protein n=1 Tax=Sphingomicrobium flavum TaxID=1229164 RepID=UPI0021AD5BE2|nr:pilus assembly protein TadG-related protein [Sphingomicrobium flavum]
MRRVGKLLTNNDGAVAPLVAILTVTLVAAAGIAFDYSRMAGLDTELQNAADQAALAAATQLDQGGSTFARAEAAAASLVQNDTLIGAGSQRLVQLSDVRFYSTQADAVADHPTDPTLCPTANALDETDAANSAAARFVCVRTVVRRADYALTPVVSRASGNATAMAVASMGSAVCKTPPVMLCNPDEPSNNTNLLLPHTMNAGDGLRLVTGDADIPGNFGWLEAGLGNGAPALGGELGYNVPLGECQGTSNVTTKTGMTTSVLDAFNTRFDVFANGNSTCPSQYGGTCSPSNNTRKDVVCDVNGAGVCQDSWTPVLYNPYYDDDRDDQNRNGIKDNTQNLPKNQQVAATPPVRGYLQSDGWDDPQTMGYPHDLCHSGPLSTHNCAGGIRGDGEWDVNAYFRVNYGWNEATWRSASKLNMASGTPSRYRVYKWEIDNPTHSGTPNVGIAHNKTIQIPGSGNATKSATVFSRPAFASRPGVAESVANGQPDRRTLGVAVLNCQAVQASTLIKSPGKVKDAPVTRWVKVFLLEPSMARGSGSDPHTRFKDIYVEYVEDIEVNSDSFETVIRRDKPYLVK